MPQGSSPVRPTNGLYLLPFSMNQNFSVTGNHTFLNPTLYRQAEERPRRQQEPDFSVLTINCTEWKENSFIMQENFTIHI